LVHVNADSSADATATAISSHGGWSQQSRRVASKGIGHSITGSEAFFSPNLHPRGKNSIDDLS